MRKFLFMPLILIILSAIPNERASAASHGISDQNINGVAASYVTVDLNDKSIKPVLLTGDSDMTSAAPVAAMAEEAGAFAAINGTYFEAYEGLPVPWGTLIRDGELLHSSNGGAVAGVTRDGRLLVDRLTFDFFGYINGEHRAIPWRINHPSDENEAITIFTAHYGAAAPVEAGARGLVVKGGVLAQIATSDCEIPDGGFVIVYNPGVVYLVDDRYKLGDDVSYDYRVNTTFTSASDWDDVDVAVGAGPSLIINGNVTANGYAEGFTESKVSAGRSGRSFIGATADGKVVFGVLNAANLAEAAAVCQSLGLVNAMCLDGGDSMGLYYGGEAVRAGRDVNNAIGFADAEALRQNAMAAAMGIDQKISAGGRVSTLRAYNVAGSNYFMLRDIAVLLMNSEYRFSVDWDAQSQVITARSKGSYARNGAEMKLGGAPERKRLPQSQARLVVDGAPQDFSVYNVDGSNYFKIRDLGDALGFPVSWDESSRVITIGS